MWLTNMTDLQRSPWRVECRAACGGFTLVELLVTMTIAVILMSIGVPSFNYVLDDTRMDRGQSSLVDAVQLAKSEAVKRNASVSVSPVAGSDWSTGLSVKVGAQELRQFQALNGTSLSCVGDCTALAFSGAGTTAAQTFRLCSSRGAGREMTLYVTGKIKLGSWNGCGNA
jgi:type IV fimbrial biogenesis protein FimT